MPNVCIGEARQVILTKCQPRAEANAIRRFLTWAEPAGHVMNVDAAATRVVVDKYESSIRRDLENLDDAMLDRATELALVGAAPKPFDHAMLAGVLVRASRLREAGERVISFCEDDADLQPWDKQGNDKPLLVAAFDRAHVWVYGDFTLSQPRRPQGFE